MAMSPPAYPAQKSGPSATKVLLIVLGVIALLCILLGGACAMLGSQLMKQVSPVMNCMMTAEMANTSLRAYAMEHDGNLPNAASWEDDIAPYYKRLYESKEKDMQEMSKAPIVGGMFKMQPPGETFKCSDAAPTTGFAFNADLSGVKLDGIQNQTTTPLIFEVEGVTRNNNMPSVNMPKGKGPKIMGDERDWVIFYVAGNKDTFSSSSNSESFDFNVEDALEKGQK